MFSVLGEVAIFDGRQGRIRVRLPGFGAVSSWEYRMTDAVFVILMLATISFDGVLEVLPDEILNPGWVLEMFLKPVFSRCKPDTSAVYETKVTKLVVYLMLFQLVVFILWREFFIPAFTKKSRDISGFSGEKLCVRLISLPLPIILPTTLAIC